MINAALGDPDATRISLSPPMPLKGLRIAIIDGEPLQDLAPKVAQAFSAALTQLSEKGAILSHISLSEIVDIRDLNARGGISPAEAFSIHRNLIASHPERIDPIFLARLRKGASVSAADYIDALRQRQAITEAVRTKIQAYDAIVMPTCPVVAPLIAEVETPQAFEAMSGLILRNCNLANFLDLPALTIPIQPADSAPVGMMLIGHNQRDYALLQIGVAVENALAVSRL
jgi:aspartyl-tRNA(Asn)/glutamyl-tRNA(Gln) amidotransferase subunit A